MTKKKQISASAIVALAGKWVSLAQVKKASGYSALTQARAEEVLKSFGSVMVRKAVCPLNRQGGAIEFYLHLH